MRKGASDGNKRDANAENQRRRPGLPFVARCGYRDGRTTVLELPLVNPISSLSEALQPVAAQLHSPREWEILRVAANLHLGNRTQVVDEARDEILRWAAARAGVQLPPEAWKHQEFEHLAGGRDCAAVRIQSHGLDTWAIRTNDPDKNVPRRVWTAEVVLLTHADKAFLSLRLVMASPERDPRVNPAVPGLVRQLASKCGLYQDNEPLASEPWVVRGATQRRRCWSAG